MAGADAPSSPDVLRRRLRAIAGTSGLACPIRLVRFDGAAAIRAIASCGGKYRSIVCAFRTALHDGSRQARRDPGPDFPRPAGARLRYREASPHPPRTGQATPVAGLRAMKSTEVMHRRSGGTWANCGAIFNAASSRSRLAGGEVTQVTIWKPAVSAYSMKASARSRFWYRKLLSQRFHWASEYCR